MTATAATLPSIFMVAQVMSGTPRLSLSGSVAELPTLSATWLPPT
jgi:hypothetical protein